MTLEDSEIDLRTRLALALEREAEWHGEVERIKKVLFEWNSKGRHKMMTGNSPDEQEAAKKLNQREIEGQVRDAQPSTFQFNGQDADVDNSKLLKAQANRNQPDEVEIPDRTVFADFGRGISVVRRPDSKFEGFLRTSSVGVFDTSDEAINTVHVAHAALVKAVIGEIS